MSLPSCNNSNCFNNVTMHGHWHVNWQTSMVLRVRINRILMIGIDSTEKNSYGKGLHNIIWHTWQSAVINVYLPSPCRSLFRLELLERCRWPSKQNSFDLCRSKSNLKFEVQFCMLPLHCNCYKKCTSCSAKLFFRHIVLHVIHCILVFKLAPLNKLLIWMHYKTLQLN